jgi:hypothetical protein
MRFILGMMAVLVAACAGQPPAATTPPRQVKVDASNVVDVQRAGYKIVDKDGQKLYCSKDGTTGTHLRQTTTCLTEQQWQQVHDATNRTMQSIATQAPPPSGR